MIYLRSTWERVSLEQITHGRDVLRSLGFCMNHYSTGLRQLFGSKFNKLFMSLGTTAPGLVDAQFDKYEF